MKLNTDKIRLMLLQGNIAKEALAERMDVSVNRIYQILSSTGKPHDATLKKLADALKCQIEDIITT